MSQFDTKLDIEEIEDGSRRFWERPKYRLTAPLVYQSDIYGGTITVPVDFVTDLTSVPRVPILYWLFGERVQPASAIHDYLYTLKIVSREKADAIFLEAAKCLRGRRILTYPMYLGLRLGGWYEWSKG